MWVFFGGEGAMSPKAMTANISELNYKLKFVGTSRKALK